MSVSVCANIGRGSIAETPPSRLKRFAKYAIFRAAHYSMHNKKQSSFNNQAFIDGQNLYLSTSTCEQPWKIDLVRFRIYLRNKYRVDRAYYFLGFVHEDYQDLYARIQEAGFILIFREHHSAMLGKKKGNVDSDIVFAIMKKLYKHEITGKIILVSGDGDYKKLVDFLIEEDRLEKLIFPDQKRASSLYKSIDLKFRADLCEKGLQNKVRQ